jgi:hypothetical protein
MADQQTFRLHIGGLGASVTSSDLEKRFAAFGTVVKVDGVGKLDANGRPSFQLEPDHHLTESLLN